MSKWRKQTQGTRTHSLLLSKNKLGRTGIMRIFTRFICAMILAVIGLQSMAQERGPVTNLPIPRFVSMKASEGNVRRGPSLSHRIDWVFKRRDMPLQITAEYGHWRRVQDRDGVGGWVHYSLLSGVRTAIVDQDLLPIYARKDTKSPQNAKLEAGVVTRIGECDLDWCWVNADGYKGWARKDALWGIGKDEIRE